MPKRYLLTGALLFLFAAPAAAEEHALVVFKVLSPEAALTVSRAALEDCREKGFQVAVAVVDRFGVVQVILRDRFAGPHTIETARRKAWTAVSFRVDTLEMADLTAPDEELSGARHIPGVLMLGGGVPVEAAGSTIGAVGVSGATATGDDECARAGIEAIQDDLDF
jgi:uncharacterized protein GlcG (DUF336 family)